MRPADTNETKAFALPMLALEMLRRELTREELAKRCGIELAYLRTEFSNGIPTLAVQYRIEAALGFSIPLWSSPFEMAVRRRCVEVYGLDPRLAFAPDVIALCRRLGIRQPRQHGVRDRRAEAWIQKLFEYFAAHPEKSAAATKPTTLPHPR